MLRAISSDYRAISSDYKDRVSPALGAPIGTSLEWREPRWALQRPPQRSVDRRRCSPHVLGDFDLGLCAEPLKVCDHRGNAERHVASLGKIAGTIGPQCDIDSMLRGPVRDLLYACRVVAARPKGQQRYEANCFIRNPLAPAQVMKRSFRTVAFAQRIVGSAGGAMLRVYYQGQAAIACRIHLREFDLEHRAVFDPTAMHAIESRIGVPDQRAPANYRDSKRHRILRGLLHIQSRAQ